MIVIDEKTKQLMHKLSTSADAMINSKGRTTPTSHVDCRIKWISLFFVAKTIRTFKAFTLLVEAGYTHEAYILTRANVESLIDWQYILKEPKKRSEMYTDYMNIERMMISIRGDGIVQESECGLSSTSIRDAKKIFMSKYRLEGKRFPNNWSGKSVRARAQQLNILSVYQKAYKPPSDIIHGGLSSHELYLDISSGNVVRLKTEPDWKNVEWTATSGCAIMLSCIQTANKCLSLGADELICELQGELDIVNQLNIRKVQQMEHSCEENHAVG